MYLSNRCVSPLSTFKFQTYRLRESDLGSNKRMDYQPLDHLEGQEGLKTKTARIILILTPRSPIFLPRQGIKEGLNQRCLYAWHGLHGSRIDR